MRDSNLRGIGFFFFYETRLYFGVIHIYPRVFLKRNSFSTLIPDVLLCQSLFYRKIFSNLDKNIFVGYQESPSKYLYPSVHDDGCELKIHAEFSRRVAGELRWPASAIDIEDARYRDSEYCCCSV